MANLEEAKARYREAKYQVDLQRSYEGRSTRTGNQVYQDAYDAAAYYISALEEARAVKENAGGRHAAR